MSADKPTDLITLRKPSTAIAATLSVPGSKSYTNRALLIASMAPGLSRLESPSLSSDSLAMIDAVGHFGVSVHRSNPKDGLVSKQGVCLIVDGRACQFLPYQGTIDVGPAGTTMRFLTALSALVQGGDVILQGSPRMHERPIHELVQALQTLGVEITYLNKVGCPPLRIRGCRHLPGGSVTMSGTVSSQFISALLLISPLFTDGLEINVEGEQTSKSYIDMTIQSIQDFGVTVKNDRYRCYTVKGGQRYHPRRYQIEGDVSGASYLWGFAAISGGTVTVSNINSDSAQGDLEFPNLLKKMGCQVIVNSTERSITVSGPQKLSAISVDMSSMPDTAQTLAVLAATASGTTHITGVHTLKTKETDRLQALKNELEKIGIKSEIGPDFITVHGGAVKPATIATYEDHRMAMSFAMLSGIIDRIQIEEPSVVEKSFPLFWDALQSLGVEIQ